MAPTQKIITQIKKEQMKNKINKTKTKKLMMVLFDEIFIN
jgi:hypothetical protein